MTRLSLFWIKQPLDNYDLILKIGAYFSTFSYNSQDSNLLNSTYI